MVVHWHWLAEEQLKTIFDYYREVSGERTAIKITLKIKEYTAALGAMPFMAPLELLLEDEAEQYRSLVVARKYKAVYYVDEDNEEVIIVDLWDCRQNPETLKSKTLKTAK